VQFQVEKPRFPGERGRLVRTEREARNNFQSILTKPKAARLSAHCGRDVRVPSGKLRVH
jgi:hypothetical protein